MASSQSFGSGCNNFSSCISTTTKVSNCKNPYEYLFYEVVGLTAPGNGLNKSSVAEVLDRVIDKGIFIQGECDLCCPDCNNIHIIASVETIVKALYGTYGISSGNPNGECEHYTTMPGNPYGCNQNSQFCGVVGDCSIVSCCNGFKEGVDELLCIANQTTAVNTFMSSAAEVFDRLLDKGIVEYGTINGESQIKHLTEWMSKINYWEDLSPSSYGEVFDRILDKGIVVWCDPDNLGFQISSVETFIKSLPCADNFITYNSEGGCCLNIKASVETYGKFLSARQCNEEGGCGNIPA